MIYCLLNWIRNLQAWIAYCLGNMKKLTDAAKYSERRALNFSRFTRWRFVRNLNCCTTGFGPLTRIAVTELFPATTCSMISILQTQMKNKENQMVFARIGLIQAVHRRTLLLVHKFMLNNRLYSTFTSKETTPDISNYNFCKYLTSAPSN